MFGKKQMVFDKTAPENTEKLALGNYGISTAKRRPHRPNHGAFCQLCGAWQGQLGLEPSVLLYMDHLMMVFDEAKRVLRPDGTLWVNIGDRFWNAQGWAKQVGGGKTAFSSLQNGIRMGYYPLFRGNRDDNPFLPLKSQACVPELFCVKMVYEHGWIRRNCIIWHKPNVLPASSKDRLCIDYEPMYFFVKSKKYYFEQPREPHSPNTHPYAKGGKFERDLDAPGWQPWGIDGSQSMRGIKRKHYRHTDGRVKRCVWSIPTAPGKETNFATFPENLVVTPIKAGCPVGGVVLDPFAGTGTTLAVARALGRQYLGFELCERDVIRSRERVENCFMNQKKPKKPRKTRGDNDPQLTLFQEGRTIPSESTIIGGRTHGTDRPDRPDSTPEAPCQPLGRESPLSESGPGNEG
jgi:site-specific DNA-methyltransferase (adenine-specific)